MAGRGDLLDVAILTGLLYLTGGPHNPFGLLYVVQIALATAPLRAGWAWLLSALSVVGFGLLLITHEPLAIPEDNRAIGVWVALGVASAFVAHFLLRITGALAERDSELARGRSLAARQERLASLATMAAGAAHELSTPLGTVALVAKELERALLGPAAGPSPGGGACRSAGRGALRWPTGAVRLIREQVGRCRVILEQMAQGAGTVGESVAACTVGELLEEAMVGVRPAPTSAPRRGGRGWPARPCGCRGAPSARRCARWSPTRRTPRRPAPRWWSPSAPMGPRWRSRSATGGPGCRARSWRSNT